MNVLRQTEGSSPERAFTGPHPHYWTMLMSFCVSVKCRQVGGEGKSPGQPPRFSRSGAWPGRAPKATMFVPEKVSSACGSHGVSDLTLIASPKWVPSSALWELGEWSHPGVQPAGTACLVTAKADSPQTPTALQRVLSGDNCPTWCIFLALGVSWTHQKVWFPR